MQRLPVHPRQCLDLHGECERFLQIFPKSDQTVVRHQARLAIPQRSNHVVRQRLRSEGRIGRAANIAAASGCNHVVEWRDGSVHARQRGRISGMGVDDGVNVVHTGCINISMKPPLGGGQYRPFVRAIHLHPDDLLGPGFFVRYAGRCDKKSTVDARADVAGLALIDTEFVHPQSGADDFVAKCFVGGVIEVQE